MRKYLSLAVVALSSGGALVAATGAASAATTANDNWRAAPWQDSSPPSMHASPFGGHGEHGADVICVKQRNKITTGQITTDLKQEKCLASGEMPPMSNPVPGPPSVMDPPAVGSPKPCPEVCTPDRPTSPTPPTPLTPPTQPVTPPPPVTQPCPPPVTQPCPPGDDPAAMAPASNATPDATSKATPDSAASAAGNTISGLPIAGSAVGGLL